LADAKSNLKIAEDQMKNGQQSVSGKSKPEREVKIKDKGLKIVTLQSELEKQTNNIIQTQNSIDKLKASLERLH